MKEKYILHSKLIRMTIISSCISSIAIVPFLFMGINSVLDTTISIICPTIFWIGLILEQTLMWKANKIRRTELEKSKTETKKNVGVISFFKGKEGIMIDTILIISAILVVISIIANFFTEEFEWIVLFILLISFRLHAIFNGKNYRIKEERRERLNKNEIN